MPQEEGQGPLSTDPTETDFYANNPIDAQLFPVGFSMDPTIYQQQYNLPASFASYTQPSLQDMTQTWATPQQSYVDHSSQSPTQQGLPPLVPRLSVAKSLVSDEGDDTSEPTSPRDEASERRKEVSWYRAGFDCYLCFCDASLLSCCHVIGQSPYARHVVFDDDSMPKVNATTWVLCEMIALAALHLLPSNTRVFPLIHWTLSICAFCDPWSPVCTGMIMR